MLFSSPPFQCEQELVPYYFPERTKQKMRMSMSVCNSDRKDVLDLLNSNNEIGGPGVAQDTSNRTCSSIGVCFIVR